MATEIKKCEKCQPHEYQDKQYGDKMRVHNRCGKEKGKMGWRCTVCGNTKLSGD